MGRFDWIHLHAVNVKWQWNYSKLPGSFYERCNFARATVQIEDAVSLADGMQIWTAIWSS